MSTFAGCVLNTVGKRIIIHMVMLEISEMTSQKIAYALVEFTHQQMHFFYFKKRIKIYIKIHINIAPTCFGPRPSSGSLH